VITAVGKLNRPKLPDIPELDTFEGAAFHTAGWDECVDLAGKRVAMIGTGASGMQTGLAMVDWLTIFQRSPHWVIANPNYHRFVSPGKKWILEHLPYYAQWYRFQLFWAFSDGIHGGVQIDPDWPYPEHALNATNDRFLANMVRHMERKFDGDPELMEKVLPDYPPFGKRMLVDNHWFPMLKRDNVDLVTDTIDHIEADAIVMADGTRHEVDVIILATVFHANWMLWPMEIVGRNGENLSDIWGKTIRKSISALPCRSSRISLSYTARTPISAMAVAPCSTVNVRCVIR
jgi:4-hydroxyacetophenone monooxygenase